MQSLDAFLADKRIVTIHTLVSYARQYLQQEWDPVWQSHRDELRQIFAKAGEQAYGVYGRMLFQPIQQQFAAAGFVCEPDFPGDFRTGSVEYWGPPEERERCLWCVVHDRDGAPLGTIVTQFFHDHTRFRLPYASRVFALDVIATPAILEALSHASVRLHREDHGGTAAPEPATHTARPGWEYSVEVGLADYLDAERPEVTESLLDHALALWGRYGWELVAVVPHQERMIAWFKRPAPGVA